MSTPPRLPVQQPADATHTHARAQPLSVDTLALQDDSVTAAKIAPDAVGSSEIAADSVGTSEIAPLSVTAAEIANDTITASQIAANAITSSELADNAVDAAAIATGAVTATKVNVPCVRAVWSANTSIPNDGVAAVAFGGTDEYDTDTMHNPAANNTRITFNTAGVYDVGGWWVMAADADGARGIYIQKNGTTIIAQKKITTACFGGAPNDAMEISTTAKFAAADYVELFAQNIAAGVALNVTNGAFYATYRTVG